ncbi:Protein FAR-RED ELONGATED HYPOCOTYL [Arachis hypogaea]|nr:Protein FAR-RED ELONGATED HYPOCOTYL [Arachis hypogaea]
MNDSTSDCQLNQGEVDYEFESNEVPNPLSVVDDQFVSKVGMTFTTLEDAGKFYRNYAKAAGFSTRVRSTNRKGNEIKNQLITCSREEKWKSKISPTEKTNPTAGLNCHARIYIHTLKDVGAWIILKVVLDHSHPCCPSKSEMLKQHRELSMSIRRTIENNEEADRHIWVPIYLDHHFWAGMRSTQRSESMHSFFNKFITRNSSLIQFIKQYDNCLGSREQAERESDAADFHTVIPCASKSSIEAQEVQAQFRGKANCITRLTNSALGYSVYEVGAEVKCQCLLFESRRILCRHALMSPRYILERRSKKVKRRHTHIKSNHDEPLLEPRSKRFDQLVFRSQNICEFTSELEELTAILHRAYDNVMAEMESLKAKRKGTSSLSHEDANLESVNELQSPQGFEQEDIANATKKKKTKVLSEINLFDAASVVHSNSSQYQGHVMNYQFRVPAAWDNSLGV